MKIWYRAENPGLLSSVPGKIPGDSGGISFQKNKIRAWKKTLEQFLVHEGSKMHAEPVERFREVKARPLVATGCGSRDNQGSTSCTSRTDSYFRGSEITSRHKDYHSLGTTKAPASSDGWWVLHLYDGPRCAQADAADGLGGRWRNPPSVLCTPLRSREVWSIAVIFSTCYFCTHVP